MKNDDKLNYIDGYKNEFDQNEIAFCIYKFYAKYNNNKI